MAWVSMGTAWFFCKGQEVSLLLRHVLGLVLAQKTRQNRHAGTEEHAGGMVTALRGAKYKEKK